MSSTSDEIVAVSTLDGLVIVSEKVKLPPGSGRDSGDAAFTTSSVAEATLVIVTVACAVLDTFAPSSSVAVAVTWSVCDAPALPVNEPVKVHVTLAPGTRLKGTVGQVPLPDRLP